MKDKGGMFTSVQPIQLLETKQFCSQSTPLRGTTRVNCVAGKMLNNTSNREKLNTSHRKNLSVTKREKRGRGSGRTERKSIFCTNLTGD